MKKKIERSMTKLADAAFLQAAEVVLKRAEDAGTPVIIWENNEVTRVEPQEMRKRLKVKKKHKRATPKKETTLPGEGGLSVNGG